MKILIVDDEDTKRRQVVTLVNEVAPGVEVVEARSMTSGLKALALGPFDLIVLDMTMPTFDVTVSEDGGRPQAFGGRELLRHIRRRGENPYVVVLTQFDRFGDDHDNQTLEELDERLRRDHASGYLGAIPYNVAVEGWKNLLTTVVRDVVKGAS